MNDENAVVPLNIKGAKQQVTTTGAPKRAWFSDEEGFTGEPLEYGGQKFYIRELERSALREFSKGVQCLDRKSKALARQQADEEAAAEKAAVENAAVENSEDGSKSDNADVGIEAGLSDERREYFENESEKLMDEANALYDRLLEQGIIGWDLPRPFSVDLLKQLSKYDKLQLCRLLGTRSAMGADEEKNSKRR